jgi:hypothetical protein
LTDKYGNNEEAPVPLQINDVLKESPSNFKLSEDSQSNNLIIDTTVKKSIGDPDSVQSDELLPDQQFISLNQLSEVKDLQQVLDH